MLNNDSGPLQNSIFSTRSLSLALHFSCDTFHSLLHMRSLDSILIILTIQTYAKHDQDAQSGQRLCLYFQQFFQLAARQSTFRAAACCLLCRRLRLNEYILDDFAIKFIGEGQSHAAEHGWH
jgi:hypothetical protein